MCIVADPKGKLAERPLVAYSPRSADIQGTAPALQNLLVGPNVFSKALHNEDELWLTAKTTLMALGLYREDERA